MGVLHPPGEGTYSLLAVPSLNRLHPLTLLQTKVPYGLTAASVGNQISQFQSSSTRAAAHLPTPISSLYK